MTVAPRLSISVFKRIARPLEVVREHFADVRHHAEQRVHQHVRFHVMGVNHPCRYRQTTRIAGFSIDEELVLTHEADGTITNEVVSGPNAGGRLVDRFTADGGSATRVEVTLEVVLPGARRLLRPLLRVVLRRLLERALEEDRIDLEARGYTPSLARVPA